MNNSITAERPWHVPTIPLVAFALTATALVATSQFAAITVAISAIAIIILHQCAYHQKGECMLAEYIWSFIVECGAVAAAALSCLLPPASCFNPKELDPHQPVIVIVNGYMHNTSGFYYLRKKLKAANFKNIVCVNLSGVVFNPFKSIENFSDNLKQKIEALELQPNQKIVLVGHSAGGITALHYACANPGRVAKVITIASPLLGTKTAKLSIGECTNQMLPASDFIQKLNADATNTNFSVVNIGSKTDMVVQPNTSAFLPNRPNTKHCMLPFHGHVAYLFSPYTAKIVVDECQQAAPLDNPV